MPQRICAGKQLEMHDFYPILSAKHASALQQSGYPGDPSFHKKERPQPLRLFLSFALFLPVPFRLALRALLRQLSGLRHAFLHL